MDILIWGMESYKNFVQITMPEELRLVYKMVMFRGICWKWKFGSWLTVFRMTSHSWLLGCKKQIHHSKRSSTGCCCLFEGYHATSPEVPQKFIYEKASTSCYPCSGHSAVWRMQEQKNLTPYRYSLSQYHSIKDQYIWDISAKIKSEMVKMDLKPVGTCRYLNVSFDNKTLIFTEEKTYKLSCFTLLCN